MKHFYRFCYLLIIICGMLTSGVNSLFPIDLVRVVFAVSSTPNIASVSWGWFILLASYSVLAISFYIGLPRRPMPKPIRRRRQVTLDVQNKSNSSENLYDMDYGEVLQFIQMMDPNLCFARYLCHVESQENHDKTTMQKLMINFIMAIQYGSPEFGEAVPSFSKNLLNAIDYGRANKCWSCCYTQYPSCNLTSSQLVLF